MPVQLIYLLCAFLALAWSCGFVGANLGASMGRTRGAGVLVLGVGTILAIGFVMAECVLFAQSVQGRPDLDRLRIPIVLMVVGLGFGNALSVWLGTARATLLGAMLGALAGIFGFFAGMFVLMARGAPILAMTTMSILPAVVGAFAGAIFSTPDEDWIHDAARMRAANAQEEDAARRRASRGRAADTGVKLPEGVS